MVDAARQMLDELMGRNRNLHPSEAGAKVNWEDPEFCQFYNVKFCPHDLFINTRADLGPCTRIHDEEARHLYEDARPSQKKRQYEDEFLRFCNVMLHDVDRKIQKGKQRLLLMQRDQPNAANPLSRHQEQLGNLTARINKLLSEAEEAGIRGDVDQAQDLMTLCDELKEEREQLVQQHEAHNKAISLTTRLPEEEHQQQSRSSPVTNPSEETSSNPLPAITTNSSDEAPNAAPSSTTAGANPTEDGEAAEVASEDKTEKTENKTSSWSHDALPEKQMKVCEICGAFLIVGDAQQRIEDHLMGKQHLGYSKLRNAVTEINDARQKEREQEDRRRREGRVQRFHSYESRREPRNEYRERSREYVQNRQPSDRRHHHHKSHHSSHHSYSRSGGGSGGGGGGGGSGGGGSSSRSNRSHHNHNHNHYRHDSRERHCRSRSRSRY
ncbi:putative RNA-binding protein Luc7-like 2 [Drosophila eugracilis]|uniref:putative RNA-binding protein Luc7-like 2 n=1 Tax=Drosophila eugracilis TaxID=29029 RepID=UPI0007E7BB99|nr:putative RNA-binding protein Luc7-like 2 [Drosophila eugracilis]XP_041674411.1 putative RNA-binding protein Luc7-like 2 [Drosophila eugracilis]